MLLEKLSNAAGISGYETEIRNIIRDELKPHVDKVYTDTIGNLFATKKGTENNLKVMVAAHMDEVGFFIDSIDSKGFLKFKKIGGIDDRVLLSKRVMVGEKKSPGVIGLKPIHLKSSGDRGKVVKSDDMGIDVGASSKDDAKKTAKEGYTAIFATKFSQSGDIATGKAFDDRAGCAVLIELLKGSYPFTLHGVFTVQEELGLRGAGVAAYALNPDFAFALEGTTAGDMPTKRDVSPSTNMGGGPAITVMDRSVISDKRLVKLLVNTAEKEGIPYQFKRTVTGGTDSGAIHRARSGVPSVTVAVPIRYIHSPVGMLNLKDFQNTVKLMEKTLQRMPELEGSERG
ncbi:M20/M25/M40 family metallo-hydrolase [Candidatus Poribacteria bacterium]|nr:M20/M25/M40 family metallo-hydrolase [Candidatus Poribacteria bacterium]